MVSYVTSDDDNDLTIDELARKIGMTVRNVRAHQSRGLLPPPLLRGRTGYYGADHIARLELIQELQTEGFNLDLIKRLLEGAGGSSDELLRFKHALARPYTDEEPANVGIADLIAQWGTADPSLLMKALSIGLVRQLPNGRFEVPSPRLAKAGLELQRLGVSLERSLEFTGNVREQADRLAQTYVDLFLETVWTPFERAGRPAEGWPDVQDALERLHPLASESLLAVFGMAMKAASIASPRRVQADGRRYGGQVRRRVVTCRYRRSRRARPAAGAAATTTPTSSRRHRCRGSRAGGGRREISASLLEDAADNAAFAIEVDGALAGWLGVCEEDEPAYRHGGLDIFLAPAVSRRGPRAGGVAARGALADRRARPSPADDRSRVANERAIAVYEVGRLPARRRHAPLRARARTASGTTRC